MSENEERAVAKMMKLMAEAVEMAWARNPAASVKVSNAVLVARSVLSLPAPTTPARNTSQIGEG